MSANDLLELGNTYARERAVPPETIIKEILHYEILHALILSGAGDNLTFQGGTCLRLCHNGTRYSEDLDFAGGADFNPEAIAGFVEILSDRIAAAYGLAIDVRSRHSPGEHVAMDKHAIRIGIPQANPSLPQRQVINLEIAAVQAHEPEMALVAPHYEHLPHMLRTMFVRAEGVEEILADKIIAVGARPYLKFRDIWDLKMLADRQVPLRMDLVHLKLADYGLDPGAFRESLVSRAAALHQPDAAAQFHQEMSRFVDSRMASAIRDPKMSTGYMKAAVRLTEDAASLLAPNQAQDELPSVPAHERRAGPRM